MTDSPRRGPSDYVSGLLLGIFLGTMLQLVITSLF